MKPLKPPKPPKEENEDGEEKEGEEAEESDSEDSDDDDDDDEEQSFEEFLRNLKWFQRWPIVTLRTHRTKFNFQMFKKMAMVEKHAGTSNYLYVVISVSFYFFPNPP